MKKPILCCVALILVLVACAPAAQPTTAPGESPQATPIAGETPQASPAVEPTSEIPPSDSVTSLPSSEDLIAQALEAGEIDYETSLLYRTYAVFGDQRLPGEFLSVMINPDAATFLFAEITANRDQLSAETMEALAPFLARPNDPLSIFSQETSAMRIGLSAPWQVATWQSKPAAEGQVRVWVREENPEAAEFSLESYAGVVDEIWPHLVSLMGSPIPDEPDTPSTEINPDSAIDVYFVPIGELDPRIEALCAETPGEFSPEEQQAWEETCSKLQMTRKLESGVYGFTTPDSPMTDNASSGYMVIGSSLGGTDLIATVAHELFHVVQFSFDYKEDAWLFESTAQWGEFRISQKVGISLEATHQYLEEFFTGLSSLPLNSVVGTHEYGAYLFSFFAQMETSDSIVAGIWEMASAPGAQGIKAIDQKFPLRDHFREFALRNWNLEPVAPRYKQADDQFPNLKPFLLRDSVLEPDLTETLDVNLLPLTAGYYKFTVADVLAGSDDTRKVTVFLGNITGQTEAGVDAIVTIAGEAPEVRYWSDEPEVIFCLDQPDQRLQELVLIISNARIALTKADVSSQTLEGQIEIEPSTEPCSGWIGTITQTLTHESESFEQGQGWTASQQRRNTFKVQIQLDGSTGSYGSLKGYATISEYKYYHDENTITCNEWGTEIFIADGAGPVEGYLSFLGEEDFGMQFLISVEATGMQIGEGQQCGAPLYSATFPYSIPGWAILVEGKYDPNNPNVLEGSKSEPLPETDKFITTWSLRRY